MNDKYSDIINLPHKTSSVRKPMPVADRAVQFAPFSALTGYDDAINETARTTDKKPELSETKKEELGSKLNFISTHIGEKPEVTVTYFEPDSSKDGGKYINLTDRIIKLNEYDRSIKTADGREIFFDDITEIEFHNPEQ